MFFGKSILKWADLFVGVSSIFVLESVSSTL